MNPSKNQGLRLTSKCTEPGWCGPDPAEDPSQREGPGTDLRISFRRSKHPLPSAPFPSLRQHAPDPAGLYICMTQPIVFICVGILKWLEGSESPHAVPTQNLSVFPMALPAQMAGIWLPVCFRAAVCSYRAQHALIWRSWHKGLPFQTTSYCCVFYSLLQSLPCSSCPVRILSFSSKSSVFILLDNLNWIFLLSSF